MTGRRATPWIRSLRGPRDPVDPWRPPGWFWEPERTVAGEVGPTLTVFVAGAECRFTCVFCDLWRRTLEGPTPAGAVPAQVRAALDAAGTVPAGATIKLYNASSFFDPRGVPPEDDTAIAGLLDGFDRVVVECHPRLVGRRAYQFAERLHGRLEVALGLETVHPLALSRLNKQMTLADFDRAATALVTRGIAVRAFVLVGAPFVPPEETVEWAIRTARHAAERGASHVTLIPVRGGNGAMEALARTGGYVPPTLVALEDALDASLDLPGVVVTADLWDLDRFSPCPDCAAPRTERLRRLNLTGRAEPRLACGRCGAR